MLNDWTDWFKHEDEDCDPKPVCDPKPEDCKPVECQTPPPCDDDGHEGGDDCPVCPPPEPIDLNLINIADTTYVFSLNDGLFAVAGEESAQVPGAALEIRDDQGKDTFSFSLIRQAMTIDLNPDGGVSTPTAGGPSATIIHNSIIENVIGTRFNDTITGNDFANVLLGGRGGDHLTGDAGADVFRYTSTLQSSNHAGLFDVIEDFESGQDFINLRQIDANRTLTGNQNFHFIGNHAFHGIAGELRLTANNVLLGDVTGDGHADLKIKVDGDHVLLGDILR